MVARVAWLVAAAACLACRPVAAQEEPEAPAPPSELQPPAAKVPPQRDTELQGQGRQSERGESEPAAQGGDSSPGAPHLIPESGAVPELERDPSAHDAAPLPAPDVRFDPSLQLTPNLRRIPDDQTPGLRRVPGPEPLPPGLPLPPLAAPPIYRARATATRTRAPGPATATVTKIDRPSIDRSPSLTTDGVLRAVPSAATFRRSSSLVADPSSQGLNLRGLAPSGVSRTLVLLDGVPMNAPFGGWVYWRSLPRLGLDHIEVVPGGGSALYGSAALGGVVQVFARPPSQEGLDFDASYGNLDTLTLGTRFSHQFGDFGAALEGEWLTSDGYRIVSGADRGPVDGETPSEHGNVSGRFTYAITPDLRVSSTLGYFREVQNGGTRFTSAEVSLGLATLGLAYDAGDVGQFELALFGRRETFGQVRARIDEARANESRAGRQRVPSGDEGGSLTWASPELEGFGRHQLLVGVDARHIAGESADRLDPAMTMPDSVLVKRASGEQWFAGGFIQDLIELGDRVELQANVRGDVWRNYAGERELERAASRDSQFRSPARQAATLSPRLGALVRLTPLLNLRAAGYRAFRAPTLNELYRSFQVGTILTAANDRLGPEHVLGGELGLELRSPAARLRLTGFYNVLDDPIVNATLPAPLPDGSARQRQNLGEARVYGFEIDARFAFNPFSRFDFAYTLARSEVTDAGAMRALVGKRLPQDPEHRATFGVIFEHPSWFSGVLQVRVIGPQWEDDLNTTTMNGYAVCDASLSRLIAGGWEIFGAAENIFNVRYLVGRAGVDTLGAPLTFRIGFRIRSPYRP